MNPLIIAEKYAISNLLNNKNLSHNFSKNYFDGIVVNVSQTIERDLVCSFNENFNCYDLRDLNISEISNHMGKSIFYLKNVIKSTDNSQYLNIVLKEGFDDYNIAEKIINLIYEQEAVERVIFTVFDKNIAKRIKKIYPEINTAYGYSAGLYRPWETAVKLGVNAIYPFYAAVIPSLVKKCHENSCKVYAYGANKISIINRLIRMGVDVIITNSPEIAANQRKEIIEG